MAVNFRSSVFAAKEETTEGTLVTPVAADFIPIREGFSMQGVVNTVTSDELVDDIGASKSFIADEAPTGSLPKYFRHSGTEGVAPEYSVMIKSAIGTQTTNSTEYSVTTGSVAGTATTRGSLEMATNDEDNFLEGQGLLIKDGVNGYAIRNVYNVDSAGNQLDLSFNLANAPASGVALGKAIHFRPAGTGQVTYSAHHYQASSNSAFHQAMAGCRTTNMAMNFTPNTLAEINFDFEGIQYFLNPITVTAGVNDALDFNDGGGEENATITAKVYNNPIELAREIQNKMDALTTDNITVTYSNSTGKYTIATDGGTLSLLWNTGTNTATTIGGTIGFSVAADDTAASSYEADNALTYDVPATPSYDSEDSLMVKAAELLIGSYNDYACVGALEASFTIGTPKTNIPSLCATSGVSSSITQSREVTFSAVIQVAKHDVNYFDKFINNTTISLAFSHGRKSGGNWVAGSVINVYLPNFSITALPIAEQDSYTVYNLEGSGFVSTSNKDCHINFL